VDDSGECRTLQDCAGEHRPGLNASIMLHLGTALRAYYDGLSSLSVRHDVIDAAVSHSEPKNKPWRAFEAATKLAWIVGRRRCRAGGRRLKS
jgi:hypothetical protein